MELGNRLTKNNGPLFGMVHSSQTVLNTESFSSIFYHNLMEIKRRDGAAVVVGLDWLLLKRKAVAFNLPLNCL